MSAGAVNTRWVVGGAGLATMGLGLWLNIEGGWSLAPAALLLFATGYLWFGRSYEALWIRAIQATWLPILVLLGYPLSDRLLGSAPVVFVLLISMIPPLVPIALAWALDRGQRARAARLAASLRPSAR